MFVCVCVYYNPLSIFLQFQKKNFNAYVLLYSLNMIMMLHFLNLSKSDSNLSLPRQRYTILPKFH